MNRFERTVATTPRRPPGRLVLLHVVSGDDRVLCQAMAERGLVGLRLTAGALGWAHLHLSSYVPELCAMVAQLDGTVVHDPWRQQDPYAMTQTPVLAGVNPQARLVIHLYPDAGAASLPAVWELAETIDDVVEFLCMGCHGSFVYEGADVGEVLDSARPGKWSLEGTTSDGRLRLTAAYDAPNYEAGALAALHYLLLHPFEE
jgi:hypothetical protein